MTKFYSRKPTGKSNPKLLHFLDQKLDDKGSSKIVEGIVTEIRGNTIMLDVGLKTEGSLLKSEFVDADGQLKVKIGDRMDVYIEELDPSTNEIILNREKAIKIKKWPELEKYLADNTRINATIVNKIKNGFIINFLDITAFLPFSGLLSRVEDYHIGQVVEVFVNKLDKDKCKISVSQKEIDKLSIVDRAQLINQFVKDQIVSGKVRVITDYGLFVDLGGIDGLLRNEDISWKREKNPQQRFSVGQDITVKVIHVNKENGKIAVGYKQLSDDPWTDVESKFKLNEVYTGTVSNITEYGLFIELLPGLEGLVHCSEIGWDCRRASQQDWHIGMSVEVKIIGIDAARNRLALSVKKCRDNPYIMLMNKYPPNSVVKVEITEVIPSSGIRGLIDKNFEVKIPIVEIFWDREDSQTLMSKYSVGNMVDVKVISIVPDEERIYLSIRQMSEDPFITGVSGLSIGDSIEVKIIAEDAQGLVIEYNGAKGIVRRGEVSKTKICKVGSEIKVKVITLDKADRKLIVSMRAHEQDEIRGVTKMTLGELHKDIS